MENPPTAKVGLGENDDLGNRDTAQQTFEIAIRRDQDEAVCRGVFENSEIAYTSKPVSKRTFGLRETTLPPAANSAA